MSLSIYDVIVIKRNLAGQETWRYNGKVYYQKDELILLEAFFNRSDLPFHGIVLREGDRFQEAYIFDRWYNIFEIYDREDASLKCWYCNITRPVVMTGSEISYIDLALDLLVFPDGRQLVLDQDEFEEMELDESTKKQALTALKELQDLFRPPVQFRINQWMASFPASGEPVE
jgi:hypothetical protein